MEQPAAVGLQVMDQKLGILLGDAGVLRRVESGNAMGVAWQFRRTPRLLVFGARANVRHFGDAKLVVDLASSDQSVR